MYKPHRRVTETTSIIEYDKSHEHVSNPRLPSPKVQDTTPTQYIYTQHTSAILQSQDTRKIHHHHRTTAIHPPPVNSIMKRKAVMAP